LENKYDNLYKKCEKLARKQGYGFHNDLGFINMCLDKDPKHTKIMNEMRKIDAWYEKNKDKMDIEQYLRMKRNLTNFFAKYLIPGYRVPS
jgi:hypothetical protein